MQKKIIVLALAAAFSAPAFAADTTVYGVVDVAVINVQGTGTKSDTEVVSGGLATSRLGVKSSEDIGNSMKASIVLEYGLDTATKDTVGEARTEKVELSGDFGAVTAGYLSTVSNDFGRFDPTGGSAVSPLGNIQKGGAFLIGAEGSLKRTARTIGFTTPVMGGVTVDVNYSTEPGGSTGNINVTETTVGDKPTAYLVAVSYNEGPVAAGLVHASYTAASTAAVAPVANSWTTTGAIAGYTKAIAATVSAKTTETAIGASYDLGMAKLFATYQTSKVDTGNDSNTAMSVSAAAPFGVSSVVLTYAKATMTAAGTDKDGSGVTLAYLNSLSKTSKFYAAYSSMSQGSASQAFSINKNALSKVTAGNGSSMIAVGVSKKF